MGVCASVPKKPRVAPAPTPAPFRRKSVSRFESAPSLSRDNTEASIPNPSYISQQPMRASPSIHSTKSVSHYPRSPAVGSITGHVGGIVGAVDDAAVAAAPPLNPRVEPPPSPLPLDSSHPTTGMSTNPGDGRYSQYLPYDSPMPILVHDRRSEPRLSTPSHRHRAASRVSTVSVNNSVHSALTIR